MCNFLCLGRSGAGAGACAHRGLYLHVEQESRWPCMCLAPGDVLSVSQSVECGSGVSMGVCAQRTVSPRGTGGTEGRREGGNWACSGGGGLGIHARVYVSAWFRAGLSALYKVTN